jgi:hypothetical protein
MYVQTYPPFSTFVVHESQIIRLPLMELKSLVSVAMDDIARESFNINIYFTSYPDLSDDPSGQILSVTLGPTAHVPSLNSLAAFTASFWFNGCQLVDDARDSVQTSVVDGIPLDDIFVDIDEGMVHAPSNNFITDHDSDELFARAADIAETSNNNANFILHTQSSLVAGPVPTISQASAVPSWDEEIPPTPKTLDVPISNYFEDLWV